jgi:hypothetical protein
LNKADRQARILWVKKSFPDRYAVIMPHLGHLSQLFFCGLKFLTDGETTRGPSAQQFSDPKAVQQPPKGQKRHFNPGTTAVPEPAWDGNLAF